MRVYILGIGGTLMASVASLAQQAGHTVSGADKQPVYPPMSGALERDDIAYQVGYDTAHLQAFSPDIVLIGNSLSRGTPIVEWLLAHKIAYQSAPEWLAQHIFTNRILIAISGTHGKTTLSSLLAFLLRSKGIDCGFLIGGIPLDMPRNSHLGSHPLFVVEADEYDTAFWDKRPKFVHWDPEIWLINNIEYDHADIYSDIHAVHQAFHYGMRRLRPNATVLVPAGDPEIATVLSMGCWSNCRAFVSPVYAPDVLTAHTVQIGEQALPVHWSHTGAHQHHNLQAACEVLQLLEPITGHPWTAYLPLLECFQGVKRRLEKIRQEGYLTVYDDFAHHPTAISHTLRALREKLEPGTILWAVLDIGSHSMRLGVHAAALLHAVQPADALYIYQSGEPAWNPLEYVPHATVCQTVPLLQGKLQTALSLHATAHHAPPVALLIMSNTGALHALKHSPLLTPEHAIHPVS